MAKARARASGAKPRTRRAAGPRRPARTDIPGLLARPEILGIVLIVGALVAIPFVLPVADALREARDAVAREMGLGVFVVLLAVVAIAVLVLRRDRWQAGALWRRAGGIVLAGVFCWGLLGLNHADLTVGEVSFEEVSSGGETGARLTGSFLGVLIWLGSALGAAWLLAPRVTTRTLRGLPGALAAGAAEIWSWRLPQKAWMACLAAGRWISGPRDERTPDALEAPMPPPYPDLDELAHHFEGAPSAIGAGAAIGFQGRWPQTLHLAGEPAESPAALAEEALSLPATPEQLALPDAGASAWELPPLELLQAPPPQKSAKLDNQARGQLIVDTLRSFGVDASVAQINEGPTVTQFGIEPGWAVKTRAVAEKDENGKALLDRDGRPRTRVEEVGRTKVRVNQITALANDLALALAAPSMRIEAPVPGKPIVGLEVPNNVASVVTMRSVLESDAFARSIQRSKLTIALGKGVSGEPVVADLAKMPHLLIAGATGSGKSVCINSIIAGILMHASPDEVRLVMIDPKRVELAPFREVPHLAFSEVIVDIDKVTGVLGAVLSEMEARYRAFASVAVRNIEGYNRHPRTVKKLPYWVVIIDELADLMMAAGFEVEKQICRLAQLARATGIHLVVATQRPSVDVITGLIKANFPTRIAFAVTSQVDSRTILDGVGAEKLLGRGDMLYLATDAAKPRRLQGVYVSDREIEHVVSFWTASRYRDMLPERFDHLIEEAMTVQEPEKDAGGDEELLQRARELAMEHSRISASLLQRRLRIGYPRAARIIDMLEEEGTIGPSEGGSSREVYLTREDVVPAEEEGVPW